MKTFCKLFVCFLVMCVLMGTLGIDVETAFSDCSHPNTWPRIGFSVGGPKDSYSHYVYGNGWYECSDCGAHVEPIYLEQEAAHVFNSSGKCTDCGYQKASCSHEFQEISSSRYTYKQISGNSAKHMLTCYVTWSCPDCGTITLYDESWYSRRRRSSIRFVGKMRKMRLQKVFIFIHLFPQQYKAGHWHKEL